VATLERRSNVDGVVGRAWRTPRFEGAYEAKQGSQLEQILTFPTICYVFNLNPTLTVPTICYVFNLNPTLTVRGKCLNRCNSAVLPAMVRRSSFVGNFAFDIDVTWRHVSPDAQIVSASRAPGEYGRALDSTSTVRRTPR
jgi:hypothetical protein